MQPWPEQPRLRTTGVVFHVLAFVKSEAALSRWSCQGVLPPLMNAVESHCEGLADSIGARGIATRNKKLLGAPGRTIRSKDATSNKLTKVLRRSDGVA